ncbi:MAG TPA: efflux RND transporter periplasmic adaptor subunit, partial [Magnetospirillaceae bacterium]|nr:efflux RND transporter periplasmic adaptor subunit [Magnetospirillaceae bacterium]
RLPGNTQPFSDAPIYARTSGYVKKWHADIGQHVKQGDVLAEIDSPEIDQQLRSARADLATAQANSRLAQITSDRYSGLYKTDSVTKQDRDNAVGAYDAAKATVQAREAEVSRLEQLQSFEKLIAPFDGVVTARNTDIGNLIDAGAGAAGRELFHLAAIDTLRIYVAVPESYVRAARPDSPATMTFDEFPGRKFAGKVVRNANTIDPLARTLTVEVDVDNPKGEILPGAYGFVHFSLTGARQTYTIPANTLLFRAEGLRAGVVRDGKAVLVPITIDRDYGDKVEVLSGLEASDQVILDPSDSLVSGTPVKIDEQKDQKKGG